MAPVNEALPSSLLDLLSNDLILRHTSPYIGIKSLVLLASTSKSYQSLVYNTLNVFQHVNLNGMVVSMVSTQEFLIDYQKINDLYAQRFSTIFTLLENKDVMQDVRTLILDDNVVPTTIIEDILFHDRYQIRLLSLRSLCRRPAHDIWPILRRLIRPDRPNGALKLRGLYWFGHSDKVQHTYDFKETIERPETMIGVTASMGAQLGADNHSYYDLDNSRKLIRGDPYSDSPYGTPGISDVLTGSWVASEWAETLEACRGLIAFDAVLCRHNRKSVPDPRPKIATVRLQGCKICGSCPEGPAYPGVSPVDHRPLLSPPPLHSSKVEVAQRIDTDGQPYPPLILRCRTCLKDRWCEMCNAWWCESCYTIPRNRGRTNGNSTSIASASASNQDIKVHGGLCVSKCLVDDLLHRVGEGGMWG